jgi:hypothetical protein
MLRGLFHAATTCMCSDDHPAAGSLLAADPRDPDADRCAAGGVGAGGCGWKTRRRIEKAFTREQNSEVQAHMLRVTFSLMSRGVAAG